MTKSIFCLHPSALERIYGQAGRAAVAARTEVVGENVGADTDLARPHPRWSEVEVIFGGWGTRPVDDRFLKCFPALRAIFYGAGSVRHFVTEEMWARGIRVFTAASANAVPVAEFTVATIILALKNALPSMRAIARTGKIDRSMEVAGAFRTTVGLLSLGEIGRLVARRLRTYDVKVIAFDPFTDPLKAEHFGVELKSIAEVFATSEVISCHTPWLPTTEKMLGRDLFASMKPGSAFINTARGAVVNEPELVAVLRERPDLHAILDVTWPEPPVEGSPLYTLPNLFLTPHIAGSMGRECQRMGELMIEEFDRWAVGEASQNEVTRDRLALMA